MILPDSLKVLQILGKTLAGAIKILDFLGEVAGKL